MNDSTRRAKEDDFPVDQNSLGVTQKPIMRSMEFDTNDELCIELLQKEIEDGLRNETAVPDVQTTEVLEENDHKIETEPKPSFFTNVTMRTKNVQHKLSTQASHLRTKFKRTKKSKAESPKTSPRNSLKASPTERKKFSQKFQNIHMPKISKPEFKRPEFTKFKRPDFKKNLSELSNVPTKLRSKRSNSLKGSTVSTQATEESFEAPPTEGAIEPDATKDANNKKRFEFGSYPKFLHRFRRQSRDESTTESREADDEESAPIEVNTIPRASKTSKARNFIAARWGRKPSETSYTDNESGKYQRYISEGESMERETSVERRMRVALKNSVEDEEEPLGILQTEEQKQLAEYDEENRAIHEISKARKGEFERRKPLVHQESDLVSEEQDFDWVECERMRENLVAERGNDLSGDRERAEEPPPEQFASNVSNAETQSSGSSSHRRRTGVIEEVDDNEFYLRRRGISQDNVQHGEYISSAIRGGLESPPSNALKRTDSYDRYYDENFNISSDRSAEFGYDMPPRKPKRFTKNSLNKSLESENFMHGLDSQQSSEDPNDYYRLDPNKSTPHEMKQQFKQFGSELSDEVPVATEYYPRFDDDDGSFYENEHMEGIEQPDILVTNVQRDDLDYDANFDDGMLPVARQAPPPTPPKAPKRRKKGRSSVGKDSIEGRFQGRSNSLDQNGNKEEVSVHNAHTSIIPHYRSNRY